MSRPKEKIRNHQARSTFYFPRARYRISFVTLGHTHYWSILQKMKPSLRDMQSLPKGHKAAKGQREDVKLGVSQATVCFVWLLAFCFYHSGLSTQNKHNRVHFSTRRRAAEEVPNQMTAWPSEFWPSSFATCLPSLYGPLYLCCDCWGIHFVWVWYV